MRKLFLTLAVLVMAICASAQKNQYFWYQGNLMLGNPIAQIDSVTFGEEDTDSILIYLPRTTTKTIVVHDTMYVTVHDTIKPNSEGDKSTYKGHEYVDLGLPSGLLWATCNVGAEYPEQIGDYYAWGELETKSDYSLWTYQFYQNGYVYLGNEISGTQYDVASFMYGGDWRMPTSIEAQELFDNCNRIEHDNCLEYVGTNGKSIFVPKSGYRQNEGSYQGVLASSATFMWTGTYTTDGANGAWCLNGDEGVGEMHRRFGLPVRPVVSKTADVISQTETIPSASIVHDTIYITIHDTVCPNEIPEGALNGVFSVAEDKKVRFAKGNLQFHMKDSIWRFADNQYEVLGEANSNCGDPSYDGFIDLFGWSTASTYFGINTSTSNDTYNGDFVDWGVNINGGWFTLNHDEWTYLYQGRPNAADLYVMASVNGVNGCIFLPDDWQTPIGIALNTNSHQTINLEEWNTLEQRGAIFLPTTADRLGTYFSYYQFEWNGYYWTSTSNGETSADCFVINHPSELSTSGTDNRRAGDAVRLVIEVK